MNDVNFNKTVFQCDLQLCPLDGQMCTANHIPQIIITKFLHKLCIKNVIGSF